MKLIYLDQIFMKVLERKHSERASQTLSRALFYSEETKSWSNPYPQAGRNKMEFLKNQNEFQEKKWILLKKSNGNYAQEGPYCAQEIFEMINNSSVRLEDPIWKEGFLKWMMIKETSTFKELGALTQAKQTDILDILDSVEEYRPEMRRVEDENPTPNGSHEVFIILDDK